MSKDHKQKKQEAEVNASKELYMTLRTIKLATSRTVTNADSLLSQSISVNDHLSEKISLAEVKKALALVEAADKALTDLAAKASYS